MHGRALCSVTDGVTQPTLEDVVELLDRSSPDLGVRELAANVFFEGAFQVVVQPLLDGVRSGSAEVLPHHAVFVATVAVVDFELAPVVCEADQLHHHFAALFEQHGCHFGRQRFGVELDLSLIEGLEESLVHPRTRSRQSLFERDGFGSSSW